MKSILSHITVALLSLFQESTNNPYQVVREEAIYLQKFGIETDKNTWEIASQIGTIIQRNNVDGITAYHQYQDGLLHGESWYYFPNTFMICIKDIYEEGDLIQRNEFDMDGNIVKKWLKVNEVIWRAESYWEEGTTQSIEYYQDGQLNNGTYYSEDGSVVSSIQNGNGEKKIINKDSIPIYTAQLDNYQITQEQTFDETGTLSMCYTYDGNNATNSCGQLSIHLCE